MGLGAKEVVFGRVDWKALVATGNAAGSTGSGAHSIGPVATGSVVRSFEVVAAESASHLGASRACLQARHFVAYFPVVH
jgi:hypothetical protein